MKTRIEMLKEMGVSNGDAEQYIGDLEELLPKYGIADSKERLAHFFFRKYCMNLAVCVLTWRT